MSAADDEVAITCLPGVTPSDAATAYVRTHARALAHFVPLALARPRRVLVSGPTADVVARLGLPPPPPELAHMALLTAVLDEDAVAALVPGMAASPARQRAALRPGAVILVLLLPEGAGVMTFDVVEDDDGEGSATNAPGGSA